MSSACSAKGWKKCPPRSYLLVCAISTITTEPAAVASLVQRVRSSAFCSYPLRNQPDFSKLHALYSAAHTNTIEPTFAYLLSFSLSQASICSKNAPLFYYFSTFFVSIHDFLDRIEGEHLLLQLLRQRRTDADGPRSPPPPPPSPPPLRDTRTSPKSFSLPLQLLEFYVGEARGGSVLFFHTVSARDGLEAGELTLPSPSPLLLSLSLDKKGAGSFFSSEA